MSSNGNCASQISEFVSDDDPMTNEAVAKSSHTSVLDLTRLSTNRIDSFCDKTQIRLIDKSSQQKSREGRVTHKDQ